MSKGLAIILALLVIGAALFAGWYSNRHEPYFPPELQTQFNDCDIGLGRTEREPIQDDSQAEWFGNTLADMKEPRLYQRPAGATRSVRLLWTRSFDPPLSVRVDAQADGQLLMTAKRLPPVDYTPGRDGLFSGESVRVLTAEEASTFEGALAQSGLMLTPPSGCRGVIADGVAWVIETSDPELGYRYSYRQSPQNGPVRDLGLVMLGLTGWELDPVY